MKVAVVGAEISGLSAALVLVEAGVNVVVYEKEKYLGGQDRTVNVHGVDLDLSFMVFNRVTSPNLMEWFEKMGVEMERSDMSFSVSLDQGKGCEWGSRNGLSGLFAQKINALNPYFWKMIREIVKFKHDVLIDQLRCINGFLVTRPMFVRYLEDLENNPDVDRNESFGSFINSLGYSQLFQEAYLIPICGSIWSCPAEGVLSFSAYSVLSFFRNHYLFELFGRPQWLTIRGRSLTYTSKIEEKLKAKGCQINLGHEVHLVSASDNGCSILDANGSEEAYDGCVVATHAPDALRILGRDATDEERRVLGAFQYVYSDIYLHHDKNLMPRNPSAWSAWNFLGTIDKKVCLTYWLNVLQNIKSVDQPPFFVTLKPHHTPESTLLKWSTSHPVPSGSASKASVEFDRIQGKRRIWFCGTYRGFGFHEDGLRDGMIAANNFLGKVCSPLENKKHMVLSWAETWTRLVVMKFLKNFISHGCIILFEDGGNIFSFGECGKICGSKTILRIHHPAFYWKVATQADLGLADAYIKGDFSFVDEKKGLLNLFIGMVDTKALNWRYNICHIFLSDIFQGKTLRRKLVKTFPDTMICNEFFSMFLDETLTYSCVIFKSKIEDLKVAQLRKSSVLIEKARIQSEHEILEIGCGWGSFAIEVVKRTGCKYVGITLSEEQLKYAENKVKEAGLEDRIQFLLCDYRQLPSSAKFDRIISCGMLEEVGHEYMEEFFGCCESALSEDGLLVLQFISIPDERYDEHRRSSDFIKEYIFPGGCLPSLSRVTSAMASASRLCVEHLENIGIHYYQTLIHWRDNFVEKQSKIQDLGFDEKFIRTWEYYFTYCAAGFKSRTLGDYRLFSHVQEICKRLATDMKAYHRFNMIIAMFF